MSRSEHGNARDKTNPRDVARKAAIKHRIVSERRHLDTAMPSVSSDAVPIVTIDPGDERVVYPATERDLRELMARLPEGSLNGLAAIELVVWHGDTVGRGEGVRGPETLGTYSPGDATIRLHAYVVELGIPNRAHVELYLRMCMLATLTHEIGHHQDFMARETRGRWRGDGDDEVEPNAEARQRDWSIEHVVPYLEEAYADEVAAMQEWLVAQLGVPIPLDILVVPQKTIFGTEDALEDLLELDGVASLETRTRAAFYIHFEDHFALALAILDHLLVESPLDTDSLTARAHVLGHLRRHDEAIAIARDVLTREPDNAKSHDLLGVASIRAGAWRDVVYHATKLVEKNWNAFDALKTRARAWIELRDWVSAEMDIGELRVRARWDHHHRDALAYTCLWHARRGEIDQALELAREDGADSAAHVSDTLRQLGDTAFADQLDARLAG